MDPILLSTATAALTVLGTEVGKATASEAGKAAWKGALKLFGWDSAPPTPELAQTIAQQLQEKPELAGGVFELLKREDVGTAGALVGNIQAEKVIVANEINTIHM